MLRDGNYSIGFSPKDGGSFIAIKIHENTNNTFMNKRNIRVKAGEEVEYLPLYIFELLEDSGDISFEELPKDNIKVEIKFNNGEILKSNIELTFNKQGKLIGKLKWE